MYDFIKKRGPELTPPIEDDIKQDRLANYPGINEPIIHANSKEAPPPADQTESELTAKRESAPETKTTIEETIGLILQKEGVADLFKKMNPGNQTLVLEFGREIINHLIPELRQETPSAKNINDLISEWLLKFKFDPPQPAQLDPAFIIQAARNQTRQLIASQRP